MSFKLHYEEDDKVDQKAVTEVARLYSFFKSGKGWNFQSPNNKILLKQAHVISLMEQEKRDLHLSVKNATSRSFSLSDEKQRKRMVKLLGKIKDLDKIFKEEKIELFELNSKVVEKSQISSKNMKMVISCERNSRDMHLKHVKRMETLECQLHATRLRLGKSISANRKICEEIDHLMCERKIFKTRYQGLIHRLNIGKTVMLDMIEQATLTYNQRDEALNKLLTLQVRAEENFQTQGNAMERLHQLEISEIKMRDFLAVKGQKRILGDLDIKISLKKQRYEEEIKNKIAEYNDILNKIREYSGEENLDELANTLVNGDEGNFSLCLYVYELGAQISEIDHEIYKYRKQLQSLEQQKYESIQQKEARFARLRGEASRLRRQADEAETKLKTMDQKIDKILEGIYNVFVVAECPDTYVLDPVGRERALDLATWPDYICAIDMRVQELVALEHYVAGDYDDFDEDDLDYSSTQEDNKPRLLHMLDDARGKVKPISQEKFVPAQPCPLCLEQEENLELDETEFHPYSFEEVRDKTKRRMDVMVKDTVTVPLIHNVSDCRLPRSRKIVQKRYE